MHRTFLAALVALTLAAGALAGAGCGASTKTVVETSGNGVVTTKTVPNIHFAKTKFVLHAGLAFGAFHRYIYKPLKSGAFASGAPRRARALLKAAAAAVFIAHELKLANADALSDDRLRPLAERIDRLLAKVTTLGGLLHGGSAATSNVLDTAAEVTSLGAASSGLGAPIKAIAPSL